MVIVCLAWKKLVRGILVTVSILMVLLLLVHVALPAMSLAFAGNKGVCVPILMYHSILKDPKRTGKYVVSPTTFREDMLYLKENGYTAVFISELIDYVYNGTPLPEKPVVITLDDGYLNNLTYVLPILEETDMKATISVIGAYSQRFSETLDPNPNYAHLTWKDIKTLYASGRVEIGNHSYDLHNGYDQLGVLQHRGESKENYCRRIAEDIGKLQTTLEAETGIVPQVFTYPFGQVCEDVLPVLRTLGFRAALTCFEKLNYITTDPECLFHLNRFNRPGNVSTKTFMQKIAE
ncbi:MAG: polysaccharide deacetylase family protein [Bacillota bacterium]|jgi:peptidoglycan/xylan/chitin deacetylase (PgdA/CDA1 family)